MQLIDDMDWNKLTFGKYSMKQILPVVKDDIWQCIRKSLLGAPLQVKYFLLKKYLKWEKNSLESKIRVTNYVNALRRGGLIAPKTV